MYLCPCCRGFLCNLCLRQGTVKMKIDDLLKIEPAFSLCNHIKLTKRSNKWIRK